ncbi:hypothetical protein [Chitinophaga sp. Cy-1792]|uniref:colicin release lysis protein n=1 Tax=Chitinophaga sp. Cy-1792 TaxID=2608339 RepID=UPI0014207E78|nr:hypothetical protein [Chitinophaga sp. Cy-1792]NIG54283.1 hypothetical protein [Chitinophaga sp. Cy-1792]
MKKVVFLYSMFFAGLLTVACWGNYLSGHRSATAPDVVPFCLISASSTKETKSTHPDNITHLRTETAVKGLQVLLPEIFTKEIK